MPVCTLSQVKSAAGLLASKNGPHMLTVAATLASPAGVRRAQSSSDQCYAVSASVSDAWCKTQCGFTPPNCPSSLCDCEDPNKKVALVKRKLPEGPLVVGYMNWCACS